MKKQLTLILFFLSFVVFSQNDSINITNLEKRIERLEKNMDTVKQDENSLYQLKRDVINARTEQEKIYEDWITKWSETVFIISGLIGGLLAFFILKETTKKQILKKLSEITGRSLEDIKQNYDQYVKHNALKKDAKILVLNEKGTDFPQGFVKVVKLFGIDTNKNKDLIEVVGLADALNHKKMKKMKKADVVIIENQDNRIKGKAGRSHWKLGNLKDIKSIEEIANKAEKENIQEYKNINNLIKLAEAICDKTAIIYYGQQGKGFFPSEFVSPEKQHLITFANAPAQLYGNLLNMLKFKNEINQ